MGSMHRLGFLALIFFVAVPTVYAQNITISPREIFQGDPALVVIEGAKLEDISKLMWNGTRVPIFIYGGKPSALLGIDLYARVGTSTIVATLKRGGSVANKFVIASRKKITIPLGIPEKLGGNTKVAQDKLVATLSKENAILAKVKTTPLPLWGGSFGFPLKDKEVIDAYGYSRSTGSYFIPHKGTDFRAATGTPVFAINDGTVRLAREFTIYGKTVAIDHGGGVVSLSMHLSKMQVNVGQRIKQGDLIGLSGDSGYALGPHLHLSVRLNGVSIDPMKFFALFR